MNENEWQSIENLWASSHKPPELEANIRNEFLKLKKRAFFVYLMEAMIVLVALIYTIYSIFKNIGETIILIDVWIILLVTGVFAYLNRVRFPKGEMQKSIDYLTFMILQSEQRKKTGIFVIAIAVIHALVIIKLFGLSEIIEAPVHGIAVVALTLGYVIWGCWFIFRANLHKQKYQQHLEHFLE